jgi:hypothetical protein
MADGERLVTVAAFIFPIEAYLLKMRLESEGIQCFLADDITTYIYWRWSLAIGGAKIKVKESDLEVVAEVLDREPKISDLAEEWAFEDGTIRTCPRCNSPVVFKEAFNRRCGYITILSGFFPPIPNWKWECLRCRCRWRERK